MAINQDCCPVAKTLRDMHGGGEMIYRAESISLGAARDTTPNNPPYLLAGNRLLVEIATGSASIIFNERTNAHIPLAAGMLIKGNFDKFWIVNPAQTGATLLLIVSTNLEVSISIPPVATFSVVTYEPNGGSGLPYTEVAQNGMPYVLSDGEAFSNAPKTLIGWNTEVFSDLTQWKTVDTGASNNISIPVLTDSGKLIAGTPYGVIVSSIDGGETWSTIYDNPDASYISNGFILNGSIILPRGDMSIVKSIDDGNSWVIEKIGTGTNQLYGGYSVGSLGFVYGQYSLYRTINGGATWSLIPTGSAQIHRGMLNANGRLILLSDNYISLSLDNGAIWQNTYSNTATGYLSSGVVDNNRIIVVGNNGTMLQSTDGGETWSAMTSPVSSGTLRGIGRVSGKLIVFESVSKTLYASSDNGATWEQQPPIPELQYTSINSANIIYGRLFIVVLNGKIVIPASTNTVYQLGQPLNPYTLGDQTLYAVWS